MRSRHAIAAGKKGKATMQAPHMTLPSMIRFAPFTQSVVTSVPKSPTSGERVRNIWIAIERLTEQKDFDPFKDSPLDQKSRNAAAERHC